MTAAKLYEAAKKADAAWSAELRKVFGRNAGDARYTSQGKSTPKLKRLHDRFQVTTARWRAGIDEMRKAEAKSNPAGWISAKAVKVVRNKAGKVTEIKIRK